MSLNNSNSNYNDNNLSAQYKSWSASRVLEILENTRGRRREQHFGSSLERIWCQREMELMLHAERYPMLTQRLLTCLLYSDRFITLESAKDNVVRHIAEMCKYAMHVHDEYTKQIRAIHHDNSICFNNEYYNTSQCNSDHHDGINNVRLSNLHINRELYMTVVKTLLRRPPSEVTFAATFANFILSQSTLPIVHDLLHNLLSEPEDFVLHRWLHLPLLSLPSEQGHELQTQKSLEANTEKSNNESEQQRQEQHTWHNDTTVEGEQGQSQHFLITMKEILYNVIYNCSNRATNTYSFMEYCQNRSRNNVISIHRPQLNMNNAKSESYEYEQEEKKLELKTLQTEVRKDSQDEKATMESVHEETCNATVNSRVKLQNVFKQSTFVKWAKQHTHTINQWQLFIKSLPTPVKTRSREEVYKLIKKHNVLKQSATLTSSTNNKNDSKNLANIDSSVTSTSPSHVHVAIPEWIDSTDSDTDKDDITDSATMKVDNNTSNNNSTKIETSETETEANTKIVNAINTNSNSSNNVAPLAPLAPVTWVQDGELTLKDGKFIILPTSAETRHRKRQYPINSATSNEQVSAFVKSNNNCDVIVNNVKANATVAHGGSDKMNHSVYEKEELTQDEQLQEIMSTEKARPPESQSERKVNTTSIELSTGNSVDVTGTNYYSNNNNNKWRTTEVVQEENTFTHDDRNKTHHKVSLRTKRQRISKQNKAETQKTGMYRRHDKSNTSANVYKKTNSNTMISSKSKPNTNAKVRNSKQKNSDNNNNNNNNNNNHGSINNIQSNDHEERQVDNKTMKVVSTHNVPLLSREMLWELLHHRWSISSTLQDALSIGLESNASVIGDKIKMKSSNGDSNDIFADTTTTTTNNNNANNVSNTSVTVATDHAKEDYTHTVLSSEQKEQQQVKQKANSLLDSIEIINSPSESTTYDSSTLRSHSSRESIPSSSALSSSSRSSQSFDFVDEGDDYTNVGNFIIT